MSQNKDIIRNLRKLIDLRQDTITANKRQMKDYLVEYKRSLELEKKLKREQSFLKQAINLLQYGPSDNNDAEESENIALNRDESIYTSDEE
jgi:hypothetical protein